MAYAKKLTELEMDAWQGFLRAHATLTRDMSRALEEHEGLTLSEYEVLLHLNRQPQGKAPMGELAAMVVLTPSGLTRLIDRLVDRDLIEREASPADARKSYAVLTAEGKRKFREAGRRHLGDIRRQFVDLLDADELDALASIWEKVAPQNPEF